ncbi:MAG: hypothetical protein Q4G14_01405 [Paracoccus sp. (in: a-proteobacteria)]|uniref:hypothetical protein n=1 Tax=Paracoccus sp. TaxID=267 RepID=UPI0026DF9D0C|nr:hypothetical protein [Paracoccus sp. (in: a-proteobacteria)]MDO5611882.1 hypothetical protein [Paracoccus sp. (in: a-proteobacteria)]
MTTPDSLTLAARNTGIPPRPATLDLLLPGDLPAQIIPDAAEAALIGQVLAEFLAALEQPATRGATCRALLARLGDDAIPARVGATLIPARTAEVEDFDRYFNVRRIASDAPGTALLRGLLQGAAGVFALTEVADLPPAQIARQVAGFAAHARLLGRLCGTEPCP